VKQFKQVIKSVGNRVRKTKQSIVDSREELRWRMIDLCEKPFIMDFDIKEEEIIDELQSRNDN
tara:strand:+ start:319 stop:507 length:189 start_codon:yes stop_codon:yes gene_type:complete